MIMFKEIAPPNFLDSVLRGIGQVFIQNNRCAGLLFLVGIFCNSLLFGAAALVGALVGAATAVLLRTPVSERRDGLFGFNGALVSVALHTYLSSGMLTWVYAVVASALTTGVMILLMRGLQSWKIPALTAPFVVMALCFLGAVGVDVSPLTFSQDVTLNLSMMGEGLVNGISQVFFQNSLWTGGFFILGLWVSSKQACLMAILGSLCGILVALVLKADPSEIQSGVYGFNGALTAIALGSVFLGNARSMMALVLRAVLGAIAATFVFVYLSSILNSVGLPILTLPFVVVTWMFIAIENSKRFLFKAGRV